MGSQKHDSAAARQRVATHKTRKAQTRAVHERIHRKRYPDCRVWRRGGWGWARGSAAQPNVQTLAPRKAAQIALVGHISPTGLGAGLAAAAAMRMYPHQVEIFEIERPR